ncbi:MAG: helix-turn-helix transcriptional regulator [Ferruginibacter sp.]
MKKSEIFPYVEFISKENSLPFEIKTIQWMQEQADERNLVPHQHQHFEMIWLTKGEANFFIDLEKKAIKNNQLLFAKPGQVHQFSPGEVAEGFVISFNDSFLNLGEYEFDLNCHTSLFEIFAGKINISVNTETKKDMEEVAVKMMKEFETNSVFKSQILRRYLKIFLIYVARQFEEISILVKQTRNMEMVHNFIDSLDKNFKEKKMVSDYATLLSVTPNYLNEIVKKNTGYPAGYHIRQRIVLEAKRLARYSNMCMKEIAYSLEFTDSAHFSKFFKTVTGANFTDFKKGNTNNSYAA